MLRELGLPPGPLRPVWDRGRVEVDAALPPLAETRLRLEWADIAKAMSIILIVLLHTTGLIWASGGLPHLLNRFNEYLTPIRLPLFFVASGLFARATVTGDLKRLMSRVLRLLWVFAIWLTIFEIYFQFVYHRPDVPVVDHPFQQLLFQLLAPDYIWFLWALAVFFVAARIAMTTAAARRRSSAPHPCSRSSGPR